MEARRAHVLITGRVQGVGFRWYCREEALRRSVAGWVRNLPDGNVEAVFEGAADAVGEMIEWCREGPGWAAVDSVQVREERAEGVSGFAIDR
jgi:acylphosphatase